MKYNITEIFAGLLVISVALFVAFGSLKASNRKQDGYTLKANFEQSDGIKVGSDVKISGIKIGEVLSTRLNENFLAEIEMVIDKNIKIPDDSLIAVNTESLLGGKYLAIFVGGSEHMFDKGGKFEYTQSSVNLESLINKFIFSNNDNNEDS